MPPRFEGRIILLLGQYGLLLPIMLILYCVKIRGINTDHDSTLYRGLMSDQFKDATVLGVGISLQLMAHLILETMVSFRIPKRHMVARWSINLSHAINHIIIWITLMTDSVNEHVYLMLQYLLISVILCGQLSSLNIICGHVWNHWICLTISSLGSLYFALSYCDGYVANINSYYGILAIASFASGSLLFIRHFLVWYRKYLYNKSFSSLDADGNVCLARMCAILAAFLGACCILVYYRNSQLNDYNETFVTCLSYTVSTFMLIFSLSYARKWHAEASEVAVSFI